MHSFYDVTILKTRELKLKQLHQTVVWSLPVDLHLPNSSKTSCLCSCCCCAFLWLAQLFQSDQSRDVIGCSHSYLCSLCRYIWQQHIALRPPPVPWAHCWGRPWLPWQQHKPLFRLWDGKHHFLTARPQWRWRHTRTHLQHEHTCCYHQPSSSLLLLLSGHAHPAIHKASWLADLSDLTEHCLARQHQLSTWLRYQLQTAELNKDREQQGTMGNVIWLLRQKSSLKNSFSFFIYIIIWDLCPEQSHI